VPPWAARVRSAARGRACACLDRRVCVGRCGLALGRALVRRGAWQPRAPRTGMPRTQCPLGEGGASSGVFWAHRLAGAPVRPPLDSGHAGHRLTTPQKNCVSRIVHAAPSQLPSTAAPVVARRVESVGQRVLVHSTERQATNKKETRHETRWPAVFAVYAGSWQLRGNRAGGLSAVQYCPPATFCQLSECGGPQPHGDRRRARASRSQLSRDSETAVGNCLGSLYGTRSTHTCVAAPCECLLCPHRCRTGRSRGTRRPRLLILARVFGRINRSRPRSRGRGEF